MALSAAIETTCVPLLATVVLTAPALLVFFVFCLRQGSTHFLHRIDATLEFNRLARAALDDVVTCFRILEVTATHHRRASGHREHD